MNLQTNPALLALNAPAPVLLPKTTFNAHTKPAESEPVQVATWLDGDLAGAVKAATAGRPDFVLHDGPPYANGDVHMGHALNKLLKDLVLRTQRAMGRNAVLTPGWDCHGLPVEWKVEEEFRRQGREKHEVPVLEFRKACRDYALHWVERQKAGFQRLGVLADWSKPYLTMSSEGDAATVGELQALLRAGKLYRALRPVLWSVPEQTALADAEVEYRAESFTSLFVRFPVVRAARPELEGASLVCWTTTPWTLPGNKAVAFAPEATYAACRVVRSAEGSLLQGGEVVVLAADQAFDVLHEAGVLEQETLVEFSGSELAGVTCRHPLQALGYPAEVPVLAGDFVTTDAGTGLVHVAPGLGPDDFKLGMAHGLVVEPTVGADGRYVDLVPYFAGLEVVTKDGKRGGADGRVVAELYKAGMVILTRKDRHDTAHSWRSKAPLVYRATPQWFVRMESCGVSLREQALQVLRNVRFYPEVSRARLEAMVKGRPDWCVSRQRAWGVPLGLFLDKMTGEPLLDEAVLQRVRDAFGEEGSDAWYTRDPAWFLGPSHDPDRYEQVMDVLDVWFESGSSHAWALRGLYGHAQQGSMGGVVADLYLEGSDQHRGWFQSSLLESTATRGRAPYRALLTHGFVLAGDDKMSKSAGNGRSPLEVADRFGADALRLWVASSDTANDVRYGDAQMKTQADAVKRFRNVLRWMLGNLASAPEGGRAVAYGDLYAPERWMLGRLNAVGRELRGQAEEYDFSEMARSLSRFCSEDLSAFWFNMRKDALYCDHPESLRRRGVVTVLDQVFRHVATWLSPVLPFAAEEAWATRFPGSASVHLELWPDPVDAWDDPELARRFDLVRSLKGRFSAAVEPEQQAGRLRSLLEVEVRLTLPEAMLGQVEDLDLAAAFGVSGCVLELADELAVSVRAAEGEKCGRCWRVLLEVPAGGLCGRCGAVS
jgi:isoleucyl-tRNA synthetase